MLSSAVLVCGALRGYRKYCVLMPGEDPDGRAIFSSATGASPSSQGFRIVYLSLDIAVLPEGGLEQPMIIRLCPAP